MQFLFDLINVPLSYILNFFSMIMGNNFAAAVFLFTLFINLALLPLTLKSQKASVGQMRIKPKLDELKKKYGDDKQRYSQEMQKLYQQENISMSGGCLPTLIRMPFLFSVYYLITQPLTYFGGVSAEKAAEIMKTLGVKSQVEAVNVIQSTGNLPAGVDSAVERLDFSFFGLNLTETPKFNIDIFNNFQWIWLIPIMAFAAQMLTSIISLRLQKRTNPDAPSMSGMMLTMPLISLFIGFSVPGAVGFYWACSSLVGGLIQAGVQYFYGPQKMLAAERAKDIVKVYEEEQKYIANRVTDKESDK
ncbi:MAG: YidC/Oxa1 family membrane protein insertase [Clostridia bacterium]|nr:YidC/Oxa1 family membrane protein insertase [Clostridia bacterium]